MPQRFTLTDLRASLPQSREGLPPVEPHTSEDVFDLPVEIPPELDQYFEWNRHYLPRPQETKHQY